MKILVALDAKHRSEYEVTLREAINDAKIPFDIVDDTTDPDLIDIIIYQPTSNIQDFTPYSNLKYVQSIWAGVDSIVKNNTLNVPLCRMVDAGLFEGMREYVIGHILADHIRIDHYASKSSWDDSEWTPLARHKTVAILGMGTLGSGVADSLAQFGFNVIGWTRTQRQSQHQSFHGADGMKQAVAKSDYIVTLLPHTEETENIINADLFASMKPSAMLINPGRGALIDEDALLKSINNNSLRRAVLDTFKQEPLLDNHPFWQHERILVTPHIAAKSRVETACETIVENLSQFAKDEPLNYVVDRELGY